MAKSLLELADSLEHKAVAIEKSASKTAIDAALAIVGDLVYKTPVDTSKALSNWVATLESPAKESIMPHFPGIQGSTRNASAAETLNQAKAVLKKKKPGQIIFITNNLPYIVRLNEGYSAQAPAGFVERAVLIGRKISEKFKIKE